MLKKTIASLRFFFRKRLVFFSDEVFSQIKDFDYLVNAKDLSNYNEAIKNDKQQNISTDIEEIIHPLYYTKISWKIIENLNKYLENPFDEAILKTIVHQSETIIFHNDLEFPANLKVVSKIWSIQAHKKGTKIVIKFDYYSDNKHIATEYTGGLLFGVKCIGGGKSLGEIPKTEKIDELSIWEEKIEIDKLMPFIYAEKAEIDAPIHTNPKFAKSIGLPNNILQGTCTFAKVVSIIMTKECKGNLDIIKSVSAKFTRMLIPPNRVTVRLLKKKKNILYFDVLDNKNKAVLRGGQILLK